MFDDTTRRSIGFESGCRSFHWRAELCVIDGLSFFFSFSFFSLGRNILIYLCADKNVSSDSLFTSYLVDPASSICLSQRLSHACLSTSR